MSDTFLSGFYSTVHTFKGGIRKQVDLNDFELVFNKPIWYRIVEDNICLDFFLYLTAQRKPFIVSSQDALMEGRTELPYFYRAKWRSYFEDYNFMTFNDPTLYFDRNLRAGYCMAPGSRDLINKVIKKIGELLEINEKDFLFYGASAGGYFTLSNIPYFPESNYIVDIARTNFDKISNPENTSLLKKTFNIENIHDVFKFWYEEKVKFRGKLLYLQNHDDEKFRRTQMSYFLHQLGTCMEEGLIDFKSICFKFYSLENSTRSHTPLTEDRLIPMLKDFLNNEKYV